MAEKLWEPSHNQIEEHNFSDFMATASKAAGERFETFDALHEWSLENSAEFWSLVWDYCDIIGEKGDTILKGAETMRGAEFFPDAQLNFAENLLRGNGETDAIIFWGEDKIKRRLSFDELRDMVSKLQQALVAAGVTKGDRIAGMMPNVPETVAIMLAVTSIGAIWSSCSPDFGEKGVLDRFQQIEPKLFFTCDGYYYNGKEIDVSTKLNAIVEGLPSADQVIIVPYLGKADTVAGALPKTSTLDSYLHGLSPKNVEFTRLPFNHPIYILFSSGTTGIPKCIVHSAGGTLIQHLKEQKIVAGVKPGDRTFYFTTCGWMMWNWLVSMMASEATLMLYDGSPFAPDGNILFDYADEENFTFFGTSAKFIDAVKKGGLSPIKSHRLSDVRVLASTGSPLAPESFDFVYSDIKADLQLASVSGGTDIISCFVYGVPTKPVYKGEIQGPGLGLAVDVWDDDGKPVTGEKGELICNKPFPSMPIMFWNDPDGEKYHSAYFDRFENCWCHGDFAEWTETGGMIIHGRSDATLNPGGVRIGTAEIYNQVEQLDEVIEGLCIGQDWDNDVRVVLFVRLTEGNTLDETLIKTIKTKIRTGASPRHVPAKVIAVADIPRTKSGKIVELAVREVVHGRPVKNQEALANAEALDLFKDLDELKS